jgi:predicted Zn-dependent protease
MIAQGSTRMPEFLSTHPDPANRIRDMQKIMPKAMEYYQARKK